MRARLVVPCVTLATMFGEAPLRGQGDVTTNPVGHGYSNFSIACPFNTLMIGATSPNWLPQTMKCSQYRADGHRFGPIITETMPSSTNPRVEFLDSRTFTDLPPSTVDCPADGAVNSFRGYMDPKNGDIYYGELFCAGIVAGGGETVSTKAGSLPSHPTVETNVVLTCPTSKFIRGFTGVNGGFALLCVDKPLIASTVATVGLAAEHVVSGTAVLGTVTLDGFAVSPMSVTVTVEGAPGAFAPSPVVVRDGARSATFQVQSALSTAGCATVRAAIGPVSAVRSLTFTPTPPSGASFSFTLQPESSSLLYTAPSTITAVVVLSPSKAITTAANLPHRPAVTFQSDRPDVLAIQTSTQRTVGDSAKVTMSALAAGCAVVTATVDGVMWRKTLQFIPGFGLIDTPTGIPAVR